MIPIFGFIGAKNWNISDQSHEKLSQENTIGTNLAELNQINPENNYFINL